MSNKLIVTEKNGAVDLSDIRFYVDGDMFSVAQLVEAWRTERGRVKTLENALRVYVSYRDSDMAGSTSKRAQQAQMDLHHMIEAALAALHSPTKTSFHPEVVNERETAKPYISAPESRNGLCTCREAERIDGRCRYCGLPVRREDPQ